MQQDEMSMATLTIRNLDAALKERLRIRAAQHGHRWKPKCGKFCNRR
jgi:hypothetical protein